MRVTIDKAGRVVIPKQVRDELGLVAGTELNLEQEGMRMTLDLPVRKARSYRKNGVLVFDVGRPITLDETNRILDEVRAGRDRVNMGGAG